MKLGITGCGMIVNDLFSFIHDVNGVELCAIASIPTEFEIVKELAKKNNIKNAYECYEDMLEDPEVDTIYLGVPNNLHYSMSIQALEKGKHVVCEKPFTSNLDELEKVSALAKDKGLLLLEAISTQYLPNVIKMKEILHELGDIKIFSANCSQYSSRYNAFKAGEVLPAFDPNKSGGALMDLGIYSVHLLVALFGEPKAVQYHANIERGIDTSGIMTLDYDNFKAVIICAKDCKASKMTSIQGDKGCIQINTSTNKVNDFKLLRNNNTEEAFNEQDGKHRMYFEFVEFERMIATNNHKLANEMMDKSLIAMRVLTKARKTAGIVFSADKNIK